MHPRLAFERGAARSLRNALLFLDGLSHKGACRLLKLGASRVLVAHPWLIATYGSERLRVPCCFGVGNCRATACSSHPSVADAGCRLTWCPAWIRRPGRSCSYLRTNAAMCARLVASVCIPVDAHALQYRQLCAGRCCRGRQANGRTASSPNYSCEPAICESASGRRVEGRADASNASRKLQRGTRGTFWGAVVRIKHKPIWTTRSAQRHIGNCHGCTQCHSVHRTHTVRSVI